MHPGDRARDRAGDGHPCKVSAARTESPRAELKRGSWAIGWGGGRPQGRLGRDRKAISAFRAVTEKCLNPFCQTITKTRTTRAPGMR